MTINRPSFAKPPAPAASPMTRPAQAVVPEETSSTPPQLLTPREVGALLGVDHHVLERWRGIGRGPAFIRLTSKTIRYPAAEVTRFLAAQTVTPIAHVAKG